MTLIRRFRPSTISSSTNNDVSAGPQVGSADIFNLLREGGADEVKNRTWAIIFAAAALVCAVFYFLAPKERGNEAAVYKDGELLYTIDLATVTETYEITLGSEGELNVIEVSLGSIRMKEANCPDGVCVKHGPLGEKTTPIVCLPNRVIIKYTKIDTEIDAVAGVAG